MFMDERLKAVMKTHADTRALNLDDPDYVRAVLNSLLEPLIADLDGNGDITTKAVLPPAAFGNVAGNVTAVLVAKQKGILAGMRELKFFLNKGWVKNTALTRAAGRNLSEGLNWSRRLKTALSCKKARLLPCWKGVLRTF